MPNITEAAILDSLSKNGRWISELAFQQVPHARKMRTPPQGVLLPQFTIRLASDELTRFGQPKPQRRRYDALALIKPTYKSYGSELLTVGVEIKVSKTDLQNDKKWHEGVGQVDMFCFAVPEELEKEALQVAAQIAGVGVLKVSTRHVSWVALPELRPTAADARANVLSQFLNKNVFCDQKAIKA